MKKAWYSKKWVIVLFHAAAWALLFSLPNLLRPPTTDSPSPDTSQENSSSAHIFSFLMDLMWIGFFYLNAFILVPRLAYHKKILRYVLLQVLVLLTAFTLAILLFELFFDLKRYVNIRVIIFLNFFVYLFFLASSTAYIMIRDKMRADTLIKEKETANLKTELSLLRSQVNPHFMFNVLNNMVSLARKQSELLEPSLIKLSSLLRYMLYEADEGRVSLEKEIDYLQSYIDLQQQRFGKKVKINVCMQSMDGQYQIEPMLLIPFVENAFKHGTGLIENAQIDIELKVEKNVLRFTVRNKYNQLSDEVKDKTSGIGLNNVTRRLNLLYGDNQRLLINKNDNWFVVSLEILMN